MTEPSHLTPDECRALTTALILDAFEPEPMTFGDKVVLGSIVLFSLGVSAAILGPPVVIAWKFAFWCFS